MQFDDETDYLMRMIQEAAEVLFSVLLGKTYIRSEMIDTTKYTVSGKRLDTYRDMVDCGQVNEAENVLLEDLNYQNQAEILAAAWFYEYVGKKGETFLNQCHYSMEEALDGLKDLMEQSGYLFLMDR